MFVRVIQHAHAFVSSSKHIFVCLKCNKMHFTWLIKYLTFSFPLKDYFYLFSDVQLRPYLIPQFFKFYRCIRHVWLLSYLTYLPAFQDKRLTNRTAGIRHRQINLTWPLTWRLFNLTCKMHTPYLTILIWSYLE